MVSFDWGCFLLFREGYISLSNCGDSEDTGVLLLHDNSRPTHNILEKANPIVKNIVLNGIWQLLPGISPVCLRHLLSFTGKNEEEEDTYTNQKVDGRKSDHIFFELESNTYLKTMCL